MNPEDFKEARTFYYPVLFTLPEAVGAAVEQTVQTTGDSFVALFMTWDQGKTLPDLELKDDQGAVFATIGFATAGIPVRDGQFVVELRTGSKYYQSNPVMIRNLAGEPSEGRPIPFPEPIRVTLHDTLTVRITNLIDRTGQSDQQRRVELCFVGVSGLPITRG